MTQDINKCAVCQATPATPDSRCGSIYYCSSACQKEDWKVHKFICKAYTNYQEPRPSEKHRLVVRFDPGKARPDLIYLHDDESTDIDHMRDPSAEEGPRPRLPITGHDDLFVVAHSNHSAQVGPANKCLSTVLTALGKLEGPTTGMNGTVLLRATKRDITPTDFRNLITSWVISFNNREDYFQGVVINCPRDRLATGCSDFEVKIVFAPRGPSGVPDTDSISIPSRMAGMPLRAVFNGLSTEPDLRNKYAGLLFFATDVNKPNWGRTPPFGGMFAVVREDGKPLGASDVKMLVEYLISGPYVEIDKIIRFGGTVADKQRVMDSITPQAFAEFRRTYRG